MTENKKRVSLIGMAQSSRHLAKWDDPTIEKWCLNESYARRNKDAKGENTYIPEGGWDRLFQMHPDWDYLRVHNFNHMNHALWMQNKSGECGLCGGSGEEKGKPCEDCDEGIFVPYGRDHGIIYTLDDDRETIPGSEPYPFLDIMDYFHLNAEHVRYFTSSFCFMMALAIYEEFDEITLLGWEMSSKEEYGNQKAAAEFWIGVAIGKGIKIWLPQDCKLLGQTVQLYGYEKVPGITKMHLEIRLNEYKVNFEKATAKLERNRGEQQALTKRINMGGLSKGRKDKFMSQMGDLVQAEYNILLRVNSFYAAMQEVENCVRDIDGIPSPNTIKLIKPQRKLGILGEKK